MKSAATEILQTLRKHGFSAYIVGGAVRDRMLGVEPVDYDIATDASPDDVEHLFARVVPVGRQFGVSLVIIDGREYQVAQFREDGVYNDGRRPERVTPSGIEADVLRRDFTVNALFWDPETDKIIDCVGGCDDIRQRIIRTVGDPSERFREDRLRMLRAVRFAARLGFDIEHETFAAIQDEADSILEISRERIGNELAAIISGHDSARALVLLDQSGLLDVLLPEVSALKGVAQPPEYHPEGDVFEHTRLMLANMGEGSVTLGFGVLLHDIGKPGTMTVTDRIRFNGHDKAGADIAARILRRYRFDRATIERVRYLVRNHMRFMNVPYMRMSTLRRFMAEDGFDELLALHRLDCLAGNGSLETWDMLSARRVLGEQTLPEPLISGRDLISDGYKPGPLFAIAIKSVIDAQMEGRIATRTDALAFARKVLEKELTKQEGRTQRNNRRD